MSDLNEWCTDCKEYDQEKYCCHRWNRVIRTTVEEMKQQKHGEWIKADSQQYFRKHYPYFTCSECGYRKDSQKKWNYCPNCGARMVADNE